MLIDHVIVFWQPTLMPMSSVGIVPPHTFFCPFHWLPGPKWHAFQMGSLQNAASDRLGLEASCSHIWAASRKSLARTWAKIIGKLLVFSDIVFNLHPSYWQEDKGYPQETCQMTTSIHFSTRRTTLWPTEPPGLSGSIPLWLKPLWHCWKLPYNV